MRCTPQAPEVLEGCSATAASDVYSFGMVSSRVWRAVAVRTEEGQGCVIALPAFGASTRVAAPVQRLKVRLVCPCAGAVRAADLAPALELCQYVAFQGEGLSRTLCWRVSRHVC